MTCVSDFNSTIPFQTMCEQCQRDYNKKSGGNKKRDACS